MASPAISPPPAWAAEAARHDPGRRPLRSPIGIHIEDRHACPLFLGRHIRGLRNGPSPQWLQDRLKSIGLRPISALVDITNFLTFDLNRPLHVFDAGKLSGRSLRALGPPRREAAGAQRPEYELDPEMTAIADDAGVQSLGGVIGGEPTGCTEATTEVFIESALFDPVRTAATGRRLDIVSDARYRFERGLDPAFVAPGLEIATRLILELCGGEPSEVVVAGAVPEWRRAIVLRAGAGGTLGGLHVPPAESARHPGGAWLQVDEARRRRQPGVAAALARRHRRRGRSRRGGVTRHGLRPDPAGAAAARDRRVAAGDRRRAAAGPSWCAAPWRRAASSRR